METVYRAVSSLPRAAEFVSDALGRATPLHFLLTIAGAGLLAGLLMRSKESLVLAGAAALYAAPFLVQVIR